MANRRATATSDTKALSTSYSNVVTVETVPDECYLDSVQGLIDTIAGGATEVTWYVTEDAAGDFPLTDEVPVDIVVGIATATDGGVRTVFDTEYARSSNGVAGKLYVWAKLDAGTCNLNCVLRYATRV